MQPSRRIPRAGARARIRHFGGQNEAVLIAAVHDGGRRVEVYSESGERLEFLLSRATASFTAAGATGGPVLELLED